MRTTLQLLATTALVATLSTPALAKLKYGNNEFSGGYKATFAADGNIGAAPSSPGGGVRTGSDDDEDDFDLDEEVDIDALEDVLDDVEVDQEDLAEDDDEDLTADDGTAEDEDEDEIDGDDDAEEIELKNNRRAARRAAKTNGDSDERVQNDFALKHAYGFGGAYKFNWKSGLAVGFNNQDDRHDLDRRSWAVNTGPEFTIPGLDLKINPSVTHMNLDVDNNAQLKGTVLSLGGTWKATKQLAVMARYNYEIRDNKKPKAADMSVDAFSLGTKYVYGKNLFSANASLKAQNNDQFGKDQDKWGYGLGYDRKLPWKMRVGTAFKYGYTDYEEIAAPGRRDDSYQYSIKLSKDFAHGLYADIGAVHKSRESSIAKNNNNGQSFYLSTGWKF